MTQQKTILLVDDDPDFSLLYKTVLTRAGFTTIAAHDGEEAIVLSFREKPDAVVVDVGLPKKDGFEVVKELRQDPLWGSKVPVIILTGKQADESNLANIAEISPTYYFIKGSQSAEEFVAKVQQLFSHGPVH